MLLSAIPAKFPIAWAAGAGEAYIRPIPVNSQIGITNGAASLTDGFPPLTFLQVGAGGIPPFGQDTNGILNQITLWNQWQQAGAPVSYDAGFSSAIGGYPEGAILAASAVGKLWISLVNNNSSDPDTGGSNWAQFGRIPLGANTTFYVSTSGNDSTGNGTSGAPWATPQHAINVLYDQYDFQGFSAAIQLTAGTFTGNITIPGAFVGGSGISLLGEGSQTVLNSTSGDTITINDGGLFFPANFVVTSAAGSNIVVNVGGELGAGSISYGAAASYHILLNGIYSAYGAYNIVGNAQFHIRQSGGGSWYNAPGVTVNIDGNIVMTAFLSGTLNPVAAMNGMNFPILGSFAGEQVILTGGARVFTNGSFNLPGSGSSVSPSSEYF